MIRRPSIGPAGASRWVLIAQIEHARIAGELAEQWGNGDFPPLSWRDELLPAIFHHDHGWSEWDAAPEVDPASGVPFDFTEMPLGEALVIWRKSIAVAGRFGPLAAYVVSAHFAALLRRGAESNEHPPAWENQAAEYLTEQDALQAAWMAEWRRGGEGRDAAAAAVALRWLQFFDGLSLWLCCRERSAPLTVEPPLGSPLTFTPRGATIEVSPWPFAAGEVSLRVSGRSVPQARYLNRAKLAAATSAATTVPWRLLPATLP